VTAVDDAWRQALAAEHRAVFGYGVLGPRLSTSSVVALARACQAAHQRLRDASDSALSAAGERPAAPQADYPDLYPVGDSSAAEHLAIRLEQDTSAAWRFAYAVAAEATGAAALALRTAAQSALIDSAVRATQWRMASGATVSTVAFPGI
jgi:uncharacterized protein DUF4439